MAKPPLHRDESPTVYSTSRGPKNPGSSGGRGPGRGGGGPRGPSPSLPPGYLEGGYFDAEGNIRREVHIDWAQKAAEAIAGGSNRRRNEMKSSAIRRFFSHLKAAAARHDPHQPESWPALREALYELKKMAAYQIHRDPPPVTQAFVDFIDKNVALAEKEPKAFVAFLKHFESVVAFYPREGRHRR